MLKLNQVAADLFHIINSYGCEVVVSKEELEELYQQIGKMKNELPQKKENLHTVLLEDDYNDLKSEYDYLEDKAEEIKKNYSKIFRIIEKENGVVKGSAKFLCHFGGQIFGKLCDCTVHKVIAQKHRTVSARHKAYKFLNTACKLRNRHIRPADKAVHGRNGGGNGADTALRADELLHKRRKGGAEKYTAQNI